MPVDPRRVQSVFLAAVERTSPTERVAVLDGECGADTELRQRVEALLKAHDDPGSFTEISAVPLPNHCDATCDQPIAERGTVIGPYKLLEQIGEGGFGVVFMAEQIEPVRRKVALKVLKPGMDTRQVVARFEAERQALAIMDHANIAKVFDGGATPSGQPYFVMELVKGVPVTEFCDQNHLTPRQRLELFIPVCQAVQHAHQKGIIHRDLKPSNVLVALYDGKPAPKVIDFGVAKAAGQALTDKTLVTGFGNIVGTLEYMSPEQAEVNQLDIDTRSDIYSLGVLLYELLAGSPPFSRKELEKAGLLEMLRVIREQEPSKPSTKLSTADGLPTLAANRGTEPAKLTKLVRGELDWIVMKALEKDRNRRYETANGFAMDVQRYLAEEPVLACPPSTAYRLKKYVWRNKSRFLVASAVAMAFLIVVGSIGWMVRDRAARQLATEKVVERALSETETLFKQNNLPAALAAMKQAEGLVASAGGNAALRQRVQRWGADLRLAEQLEGIPLVRDTLDEEGYFDVTSADKSYRAAFAVHGLNLQELGPGAAVEWIKNSTIRYQIVSALDDWAMTMTGPDRVLLYAILRQADPDQWRDKLRQAFEQGDNRTLLELAKDEEILSQPPATVTLLAMGLYRERQWALGADVLQQAQQRYPSNFWINLNLAIFLSSLHTDRLPDAITFYRVALALRPGSSAVRVHLGLVLSRCGQRSEAENLYREAIHLHPHDPRVHCSLGWLLRGLGKPDEAEAEYREALRINPKFDEARTDLAQLLRAQGRWTEARDELREAVRLGADLAGLYFSLGQRHRNNLPEAEQDLREAARLKPDNFLYRCGLGSFLYGHGKWTEAIAEWQEAIRIDPNEANPHQRLAQLFTECPDLSFRDPQRAVEEAGIAVRLEGESAGMWTILGQAQYRAGAWKESIESLQKSIDLLHGPVRWQRRHWFFLAMAHWQLGQKDQARRWYLAAQKSMAEKPIDEELYSLQAEADSLLKILVHLDRGRGRLNKGSFAEAEAEFREAVALDPDNVEARVGLAKALLAQRAKSAGAEQEFRAAVCLEEDNVEARVGLGQALLNQNKVAAAEVELRDAVRCGPDSATARFYLGEAFRRQDKLSEAEESLSESARLSPRFWSAYIALGEIRARLGQWDKAAADLERGVELSKHADESVIVGTSWCALVQARSGNIESWRKTSRQMLSRFGGTKTPSVAAWIVRTCLLLPDGVNEDERVAALALLATRDIQVPKNSPYFICDQALIDHRAGKHTRAIESVKRLHVGGELGIWRARGLIIMALAQHQLDRTQEGRTALEEAKQIMAEDLVDPVRGPASNWVAWAISQVLYREAEELLQEK